MVFKMASIKKIDHIGIVVPNIQEGIEIYKQLLLRKPIYTEYIDASKVQLAFFDVGGVQIELLAPTSFDSEVMLFLKQTGGGLHHICYEVEKINDILTELKDKGFRLIDEIPRPGSRNTQIAFVDPKSTKGVYIEYCEFINKNQKKG
jgi:methylmalonyl-CoA epimerase